MSSPLIKVPFIIANALAAQVVSQPPTPPADSKEQEQYKKRDDTRDIFSRVVWFAIPMFWASHAIFNACDLYIVLSTVYPSLQIPLLSRILLPAKIPTSSELHLTWPFAAASFLLYIGAYLRYVCYQTLGRHFTFELSLKDGHKLITYGPYSIVRHPSYLATTIALPAMAYAHMFCSGTWFIESHMWQTFLGQAFGVYWTSFVAFVCGQLLFRVSKEDLLLKTQFKEEWINWSRKTRYAVIPYVW